jgi:iron complex outermembrane receptor protein
MFKLTPSLLAATTLASISSMTFASSIINQPLNITVTGTRSLLSEEMAGKTVSVITRQQISASGAFNVFEALRSSGTVQITQNYTGNSNDGVVSMRGFGENSSQNVLILVDGRPLNNPTLEAPDLSIISLNNVERIEVLQGSAGVLYGQNAVGGVINIITRSIEGSSGQIQLSAGSYDTAKLAAGFDHRYENGLGVRLNMNNNTSNGYRDNSENEFKRVEAGLSYRYHNGEIGISHQVINDNQRLPGSLSDAQVQADPRAAGTPNDFFNNDVTVSEITLAQSLSDKFTLHAEASQRDSNGKGVLGSSYSQDTRVNSFTPRITGHLPATHGDIILTAGYDYRNSDFQAWDGYYNSEQTAHAFYTQVIYPLSETLSATVGARNTRVKDNNIKESTEHSDSAFVKEFGINWQLRPNHKIFLRRDENVRFAAVEENGYTPSGIDFLQPQEGTSWELGWQGDYQKTKLILNLYRLELDNEILYDAEANAGWGANLNMDRSLRKGIILGAEHALLNNLKIGGTYTYTDSELLAGSFKGNEVPFVARHTFNIFANYRFDQQWNLYVDGQYTGERYLAGDDANALSKIDGYVVMNASLKWQRNHWTTQLTINNMFNEEYDAYIGNRYGSTNHYPAPERNMLLTVGYAF